MIARDGMQVESEMLRQITRIHSMTKERHPKLNEAEYSESSSLIGRSALIVRHLETPQRYGAAVRTVEISRLTSGRRSSLSGSLGVCSGVSVVVDNQPQSDLHERRRRMSGSSDVGPGSPLVD